MKKLLLLLLVLPFVFASCTSKEDKAKDVIKEKLSKILKDYGSYEEIETSSLYKWADSKINKNCECSDSLESISLSTFVAQELILTCKDKRGADFYNGLRNSAISGLDKSMKDMDRICTKYSICDSYTIKQRFRSKNGFGGYGISEYWFKIDKDITKVESIFEIPLN